MPFILVRHKVEDYAKWKPVYDEHGAVRKASGSKGARLLRNTDNPNETVILMEWDTIENAKKFASSDNLREVMQRAGVAEMPDVYFLDEVQTSPA
jgi:heme-degrading monooxygenase HmoA